MEEKHLQKCQREAEEVTEIMLENYNKVLDREGKLSDLDERANELRNQARGAQTTSRRLDLAHEACDTLFAPGSRSKRHPYSSAFSKTTRTLAQKKRWENLKYKIILGAVVVAVVLIIILAIVLSLTLPGSGSQAAPAQARTGGD